MKTPNFLTKAKTRVNQATLAATVWVMSGAAHAALPTVAPPSRGSTSGNFLKTLQDYSYDFAIFGGLMLSALALFVVAKNVITTYNEVPSGRATMGGVAAQGGVGVLLLLVIVFLVTEASKVL